MPRSSFFALFTVAACAGAPQSHVDVDIVPSSSVVQPTVSVSDKVRWLSFRVEAVIRNQGPESVFLPFCAESLEFQEGASWITVWRPVCVAMAVPPRELRAGQELPVTVPISAALTGAGAPEWRSARVGGRYRLVLGIFQRSRDVQVSGPLPLSQRVSPPFLLEEPRSPQ